MLLLNFEQVFTTHEFVKVVTVPLEDRPGLEQVDCRPKLVQKKFLEHYPYNLSDVDTSRLVISHRLRLDWDHDQNGFPIRPFDINALIFAQDQCFSRVTLDSVTQFGLRPPELYWIRHLRVYVECFQVSSFVLPKKANGVSEFDHCCQICSKILDEDYERCGWVDAHFHRVRVRLAALSD
jgi:hypothetical protein